MINDFIDITNFFGKNPVYVQGAGGNSSVKIGDKLLIKSSGIRMANVTRDYGLVEFKIKTIKDFILKKNLYSKSDEKKFFGLLGFGQSGNLPPSMEIGFHAIIPSKYVFHLHFVYSNIFMCMNRNKGFKKIVRGIGFEIFPYLNPGYQLAFNISKKRLPLLIFLKNHGVIVHSNSLYEIIKIMYELESKILLYLIQKHVFEPFKISRKFIIPEKFIFPDAAVFGNAKIASFTQKKRNDLLEIFSAQEYILKMIGRLGGKPIFLKKTDVALLSDMEQEKYRIRLNHD